MIRKHIYISEEINEIIKRYSMDNNLTYSQAIVKLSEKGLCENSSELQLLEVLKILNQLSSKTSYIKDLLEQFYTDMGMDLSGNPSKDKYLNQFKRRYLKKNIDE